MNEPITIRPFAPEDNEAVVALMMHQDEWLYGLDGRLRPPRPAVRIQEFVAEKVTPEAAMPESIAAPLRDSGVPLADQRRLVLLGHGGRPLWAAL